MRRIEIIWSPLDEDDEAVLVRELTEDEFHDLDGGRVAAAEKRLGVRIPTSLGDQMVIEDGGQIGGPYAENIPFQDRAGWGNAVVDGLLPLANWGVAADSEWFVNWVESSDGDEDGLALMIYIAHIAESFLCLDYRECGREGDPRVVYVDTTFSPKQGELVCETVDALVKALVECNRILPRD